MTLWEERAARNEALFREVNEQAESLAHRYGDGTAGEFGVVCECSNDQCVERLFLPVDVYEEVRRDPRQFLVAPGHEGDFERVVETNPGYVIVRKQGAAGRLVEQFDPRSRS